MNPNSTNDKVSRDTLILDLTIEGKSLLEIAQLLGISERTVSRVKTKLRRIGLLKQETEKIKGEKRQSVKVYEGEEIEKNFNKDSGSITTKSLHIKTLEDALRVSKVDKKVWDVDRYVINSWEVTMGVNKTGINLPETYTNYQVKVWLKKRKSSERGIADLLPWFKEYAPKYSSIIKMDQIYSDDNFGNHLLELALYDHHFGMLAWALECGRSYDIKIADNFFVNGVKYLLNKVKHFNISKIVFPIGNDFFHANDASGVTPRNKNKLETDGRFAKVFEAGKRSVLKSIDLCQNIAPVEVIWVPGNHDPESSYYLVQVIDAQHYNNIRVNVDCSPKTRKRIKWGVNFIGFSHGCDENIKDLPRVFMDEFRTEYSDSLYKEIHIGHVHKKKEHDFVSVDTYGSTIIRVIPSMCNTDPWHYSKGYIGGDRACQAYLYNEDEGLTGVFDARVFEDEEF